MSSTKDGSFRETKGISDPEGFWHNPRNSTSSLPRVGRFPDKESSVPDVNAYSRFRDSSSVYKEFLAERAEILKHKWLESEKAGEDIGLETAIFDWVRKHRQSWIAHRRRGA